MLFKGFLIIISLVLAYLIVGIATTAYIRFTNPLKKLNKSDKTIYLTFDDGINNSFTPLLLDLLKEHSIKASFFLMASSVSENQAILQRMKDDDHAIGLHSFNHKNQIMQSPIALINDFDKSVTKLQEAGASTNFYRPPWGHSSLLGLYLCKVYQLKMVLWNVIIQDWEKTATAEILCDKLKAKVHGNAVICLHDGRGKNNAPLKTLDALKKMIPIWKKEGYRFETLYELYQKANG